MTTKSFRLSDGQTQQLYGLRKIVNTLTFTMLELAEHPNGCLHNVFLERGPRQQSGAPIIPPLRKPGAKRTL